MKELTHESSAIGLRMALTLMASAFSSLPFGPARRKLSSRAASCCSFAAVAPGIVAVSVVPNYAAALSGLVAMGLGSG